MSPVMSGAGHLLLGLLAAWTDDFLGKPLVSASAHFSAVWVSAAPLYELLIHILDINPSERWFESIFSHFTGCLLI